MLIHQVRSLGSLSTDYGEHVLHGGKPNVSFGAPTYFIGGSNFFLHGRAGLFYLRLLAISLLISDLKITHDFEGIIRTLLKAVENGKRKSNQLAGFHADSLRLNLSLRNQP